MKGDNLTVIGTTTIAAVIVSTLCFAKGKVCEYWWGIKLSPCRISPATAENRTRQLVCELPRNCASPIYLPCSLWFLFRGTCNLNSIASVALRQCAISDHTKILSWVLLCSLTNVPSCGLHEVLVSFLGKPVPSGAPPPSSLEIFDKLWHDACVCACIFIPSSFFVLFQNGLWNA